MEEQLKDLYDLMGTTPKTEEKIELDCTDMFICMECISKALKNQDVDEPSVVKESLKKIIAYAKQEFPGRCKSYLTEEDIEKLLDC